ncbi:type IV pilus assembly protein PilM [Actinotalea ferrariae]|nr:type IV pilus assembly protein PilM [Actinotalea ferrariae]
MIGLDLGTTYVRAVEVQQGRTPTVLRCAEAPLPLGAVQDGEVTDPGPVVDALRRMWLQTKFSHKDVVIGVGNQRVLVRNLDLPWLPMAQLRASLPYQVQDNLPVAVEDALLDFYPTAEYNGESGRSVQGLLVAATRDTVQANVAAVESAGLRPLVVDLNAFALVRAHMTGDLRNRIVALVDIGARITNVVVARHGNPVLVRTLPAGGQHLTDAIAAELSIPNPEAEAIKRQVGVGYGVAPELRKAAEVVNHVTQGLVESIRNTLVYYASTNPGQSIDGIVLTGGAASLSGLGQYLSSASRLPVAMGDVLSSVTVSGSASFDGRPGMQQSLAVPLGLALAVAA